MKLYAVVEAEDLPEVREKGLSDGYPLGELEDASSWVYETGQIMIEVLIEDPERELEVDEQAGEDAWERITNRYNSTGDEAEKGELLQDFEDLEGVETWKDSLRVLGSAENTQVIPPQRISVIVLPGDDPTSAGSGLELEEFQESLNEIEAVPILGLPALFWVWIMYLTQAIFMPDDKRRDLDEMVEETFIKKARKVRRKKASS
jgi:hypothetical protein